MTEDHTIVSQLQSRQVRTLVATGLGPENDDSLEATIETLNTAVQDSDQTDVKFLITNLRAMTIDSSGGLLAFQKLTCADDSVLEELTGLTILDALTVHDTSAAANRCLADYGAALSTSVFPESTRLAGCLVRVLAQAEEYRTRGKALPIPSPLKEMIGPRSLSTEI